MWGFGAYVSRSGIGIDRFDADGKVVDAWDQWDDMTLMRNVCAIPEAATAAS